MWLLCDLGPSLGLRYLSLSLFLDDGCVVLALPSPLYLTERHLNEEIVSSGACSVIAGRTWWGISAPGARRAYGRSFSCHSGTGNRENGTNQGRGLMFLATHSHKPTSQRSHSPKQLCQAGNEHSECDLWRLPVLPTGFPHCAQRITAIS